MKFGNELHRQMFLPLRVNIEEWRHWRGARAHVRNRNHGSINGRNYKGGQNAQQDVRRGKQRERRLDSSTSFGRVRCAFRSRHAKKSHGKNLGEAGNGQSCSQR
jgi:hypothetical protein